MKLSDAFPSKWLSSDDLEDGDLIVTIDDNPPVEWQEFTEKGKPTPQNKPVMHFSHPRGLKPLILNKTNFQSISKVLGSDETDDWAGQKITLYATEVESFGQMTMAVRVRLKAPTTKPKAEKTTGDAGNVSKESLMAELRGFVDSWPDRKQIGAEMASQLAVLGAENASSLDQAGLQKLVTGLELWIDRNRPKEDVTTDKVPF